jgi:hypothetical protein
MTTTLVERHERWRQTLHKDIPDLVIELTKARGGPVRAEEVVRVLLARHAADDASISALDRRVIAEEEVAHAWVLHQRVVREMHARKRASRN